MEKIMNSNQGVAMMHDGIEGTGKHFVMNGESADTLLTREKQSQFNDGVDKIVDKFESHNQALKEYSEHINETINGLEIMPMFGYLLIKPFEVNPFQQIKIDKNSGLITDLGGLTPEYKSNETGDVEESRQFVRVGTVIETGHKCEFVQPGDVVMYTIASENPVPFFRQGFVAVSEQRILAVVNSGLTQRKEDIKNGNNG